MISVALCSGEKKKTKQIVPNINLRSAIKTLHVGFIHPFSLGSLAPDFLNQRAVLLGWL